MNADDLFEWQQAEAEHEYFEHQEQEDDDPRETD